MSIARIGVAVLGGLAVVVAGVVLGARLADGPLAMLPGGAFRSGEWVLEPVADWSFAADTAEIEFELEGERTSRTAWILVHDGDAWIPCSLGFPPLKSWHLRAVEDGRAVLRTGGKRYPVTLTRDDHEPTRRRLGLIVREKYERVPPSEAGAWFFRIASRPR